MPHYIAFLRGMNLGHRRIKMDDLRGLFEELKFSDVTTFIASGNVIFRSRIADAGKLEAVVKKHLERSLGYPVDTFIRTRAEVADIAAFRPFGAADFENPAHTLYVGFFAEALSLDQATRLVGCRTQVDEFLVRGREYFWLCRIKSNESIVWTTPEMKALKLPSSSMRNLTTIRKLAGLYPPAP